MFAVQADGADIRTIEGMANADGTLHALQEGFREMHGLQCGFCTPGMIVRAYRLLQENAEPERGGDPLRHFRQPVPLHGLPEHRQGHSVRRRQAQRRAVPGGRRMTNPTPTSAERAEKLQGMGCKRKRVEDIRFIQGKGNYVDDLKLPGMLYGDFTRSPHAHARIKTIDTSKAKAVPGVLAVLTAADLKTAQSALHADARRRRAGRARRGQGALSEPGGRVRCRRRPLHRRGRRRPRRGRIRADCPATSIRSRRWRRMRPCCARISRARPRARTASASTTTTSSPGRSGTRHATDAAFRKADVTIKEVISYQRVHPCPLETCQCVASFDKIKGELTRVGHVPGAARHPHGRHR